MFKTSQLFTKSQQFKHHSEEDIAPSSTPSDYVLVHNLGHSELTLINSLVASIGYRVIQVNSISSAVKKCMSNAPVAVIGDCTFDKDEARNLIESIREIRGMNEVQFLYFCDKDTSPDELLNQKHGNFEYLFKPVLVGQLRTRLESMMQSKNWRQNVPGLPTTKINIEQVNKPQEESTKSTPVLPNLHPPTHQAANNSIRLEKSSAPQIDAVQKEHEDDFYDSAVNTISEQIDRVKRNEGISFSALKSLAKEMLEKVNNDTTLEARALNPLEKRTLPVRIVNMVVFAVMIGQRMRINEDDMFALTLTGFTHGLGMALVPESILNQSEKLTDVEYEQVKRHLEHTNDLIRNAIDYSPDTDDILADISYQVHESEDGSGYPRGLKSNEINILAKILAVTERFVAFCHPRPDRTPFIGYEALQRILKLRDGKLNPKVIKALVIELTIFPISSLIKLNNHQIGKVISTNKSHPLRPVIEILFDESGDRLMKPVQLDLKEMPFLYIAKTLLPDELPQKIIE
ncbi:MAG: hypothetical protein HQ568_11780 [Calditrichaeota bacterium]|nr:hypothetical protein [Calditrichota bacterium]